MSFETLLKQIYTFLNTLSIAHTEHVMKWGSRNLQNAFKWAKYAEELHSKLKDRPFRSELDGAIQDMSVHFSPVSSLQINFDILGKASEILFWTLIQNPYLPETLTQELFLSYDSQQDRFFFQMDVKFNSCVSNNDTLATGQEIYSSLNLDKESLIYSLNSQAKCLVDGLLVVIDRRDMQQDQSKIDAYLKVLCERLCGLKDGLAVVLSVYLQTGFSDNPIIQHISKSIFQYIKQKSDLQFETVPSTLLLELINADFKFTELFVEWLVSIGRKFSLKYPEEELYTWTCPDIHTTTIDFNALRKYFGLLLNVNGMAKKTVQERLKQCSEESFVNVFKDILKSLE